MNKQKVIVIVGPTASGKSKLSLELAKKINGEIVSADSMQIYKDMNIGTAKESNENMKKIKHYMIDIISPEERYSVSNFKKDAETAIEEILNKGKTPIVVGGTGLYVNSLIYGIDFPEENIDKDYRDFLNKVADEEGLEHLYEEAVKIDKIAMEKISKNDKKRIIRVLEIYKKTGKTKTELEKESRKIPPKYDYYIFSINLNREILYQRINNRVDEMIENGLIEEVRTITEKYATFPTAMQGLGYKEVVNYLNHEYSKDEMVEKIKMETRRYAKRQITWFKRINGITWLDGEKPNEENVRQIMAISNL